MKYLLIVILCLPFLKLNAQDSNLNNEPDSVTKTGMATYYHRKFEGRKTSSGVKYRSGNLTAAHRTLPFGTKVLVTNPLNGKSVIVKINDRGPFIKRFVIDLSESAARKIGIFSKGVAKVQLSYAVE
jgi:rare lipoprotein A